MTDIAINPVTRRVQFQGTTGTGPFAFNFNILQASDIAVYKNNTLLSIGTGATNYSVSIASNGTGSVSVVTALIASDVLVIIGGRELSRTTDFVTAGDLLASSLNEQLDSNVVMSQQLDESISRSIRAQPGDTEKTLTLPLIADRANEIIKFDGTGNVTTIPVSEILGADIDTQKVTVKTSGGVVKAVIDGNTTNILTVTGPVVLKEGTNTRITINPGGAGNNIVSDGNILFATASGDIDLKPLGGQINILGTSGQQRLSLTNSAQAKFIYFQNSNTTSLGVVDPTGARTLLLPNASDTLVGKATTDTLTNKTLASPVITGSLGVGTLTGSGDILLDAAGDIVLDAAGDQIFFKDGGTLRITFNLGAAGTSMVSASDLIMAVTSGGINFKPQSGTVDFLQNSGAQAVQINSAGSSTITYFQNSNTTKLGVVNPTGSRVLLLPNASDTLVGLATTDTLTNKTLANPTFTGNLNFSGDIALDAAGDITLDADGGEIFIKDGGALKLTFTGSTLTSTGLTGINLISSNDIALQPAGGQVDILGTSGQQRILITNSASPTIKYFQNSNTTSLGITDPTGTRLLLLPDASDTLVGKATTDTLTNKTLTSPTITGGLNMSDVDITNVGSITLDRIANDSGAGILIDSSSVLIIDTSSGQVLYKDDAQTRLTFAFNSSGAQSLTAAGIFSLTATGDINLRPNGGQLYVLNNAGGDNFQFNTSATPTLGIHQNSNVTNLGLVSPTATRNILFPDASDTLVGKATTDTLTNKTLTSPVINTGVSGSAFLDEDNFASNSATKIASQQSIKAYVDAATAGGGAGSLSTVLGIGNTTGSNNVLFGDNNKAIFGAGSDLQIYHDGSNSYIKDTAAGVLHIMGSSNVQIEGANGENMAVFTEDGAVALFYNNAAKLATTSTGIDVTGTVTADGLTVDGTATLSQSTQPILYIKETDTTNLDTRLMLSGGKFYYSTVNNDNSLVSDRLTIDNSSGNVGIGDSSPSSLLSISKNSARTNDFENMLKIIHSSSNTTVAGFGSAIYFLGERNNGALQGMGRLIFDAEVNSGSNISSGFSVQTATAGSPSEKFRITHDGNVLVGKTATDSDANGVELLPNGTVYITANNTLPFYINRRGTSGANEMARFSDDGSTKGKIGTNQYGEFNISSEANLTLTQKGGTDKSINFATDHFGPFSGEGGTVDLGRASAQWKDAYLSGGVYLGGTGAANKLEDYEEGTASLVISGSTSGSTTYTQSSTNSLVRYTKIGRLVHVNFLLINQTFPTFAGDVKVNLPFTSSASGSFECRSSDVYFYNSDTWDNVANFLGVVFRIQSNSSFGTFGINQLDNNRQLTLGSSNTSLSGASGIYMRCNITYETDS